MIVDLLYLFYIFFKVGLFSIGGGLAAIPLIQSEVVERGWITLAQFSDMIAVSESTPGPIGVNVATYVGFSQYGILGGIVATIGLVAPSLIIIISIAGLIIKYRQNKYVDGMFKGIRPAVTGLILSAAVMVAMISLVNIEAYELSNQLKDLFEWRAIIMFGVFLVLSNKWKIHPIYYIAAAGVLGLFLF
jgi:chromate transporter